MLYLDASRKSLQDAEDAAAARADRRLNRQYIATLLGFIIVGVVLLSVTPAQPGIGAEGDQPLRAKSTQSFEVAPFTPDPIIRDTYTVTPAPLPLSAAFDPTNLPACPVEDAGEYMDCYWDASTRGNGLGTSFYAIGGEFIYLP